MVLPQNGWFSMDDLGVPLPLFSERVDNFFVCQEFEVLVIGGRSEQTGQTSKLELGS